MILKNSNGFSLVEMMIVVAIISLLAAIGIPQYSKFKRKAHETEAKVSLGALYISEKSFHSQYSFYHTSLQALGFGLEGRHYYNVGFGTATSVTATDYGFWAPVDNTIMSIQRQCVGNNGTGTDTSCQLMVTVPDIPVLATTTATDFYAYATSSPALYSKNIIPLSQAATLVAEFLVSTNQAVAAVNTNDVINCAAPNLPPALVLYCGSPDSYSEDTSITAWTIDSTKTIKQAPFIVVAPGGGDAF